MNKFSSLFAAVIWLLGSFSIIDQSPAKLNVKINEPFLSLSAIADEFFNHQSKQLTSKDFILVSNDSLTQAGSIN